MCVGEKSGSFVESEEKIKIKSCKNEDKTRIMLHNFVSMCISPFFFTHVVFVCGAKSENFVEKKMNWGEWELYKKGRWKKFQEDLFCQIILCKFIDLGMDTMHETTFTLKNSIVREEVFSFFQNNMQKTVRCKIIGNIYIYIYNM